MRHGSGAVPGHLLPLHLQAVGRWQALRAKVPVVCLHQSHFRLLPPHDGDGEQWAAAVQHLVFHRLEDRRARGHDLHPPVRAGQPAYHPGHHRAEPAGVRSAVAHAPEDRAAPRHQSQRPRAMESSVLGCGDADDGGPGDDLRGGSGLFGASGGESV